MAKDAAVTVRLPGDLKRRIVQRARRERRSLSAQMVHELERAISDEPASTPGRLLGRFRDGPIPSAEDFREVRTLLWGRLPRAMTRR
jgi:hypothetical protein